MISAGKIISPCPSRHDLTPRSTGANSVHNSTPVPAQTIETNVAYNNRPQIMCRIDLSRLTNLSFLNDSKNNISAASKTLSTSTTINRRRSSNQSQTPSQDDERLNKRPVSRNLNRTTNNNQDDDERLSSSKENLLHPQFLSTFTAGSQLENGRLSSGSNRSNRMDGGSSSRSTKSHSSRERSVGRVAGSGGGGDRSAGRGDEYFSPKSYDDQASNSSNISSSIKKEPIKTEFISSLPDYNSYNSSSPKLNLQPVTGGAVVAVTENGGGKQFGKIKYEPIKAEDMESKGIVNKNAMAVAGIGSGGSSSSGRAEFIPNVERKRRSSSTGSSYKDKKRKNGSQVS